eukprot:TRINITY_DN1146_c0_g1_i2.p1 TRINITY_DN1146_c0_g1~~TRINITY_DN1146_c0_g1_i2.p1  ORF type:complete len:133 (-),score=14.84 TRINITY_DN1146_c0_g1_i2:192-590(-)
MNTSYQHQKHQTLTTQPSKTEQVALPSSVHAEFKAASLGEALKPLIEPTIMTANSPQAKRVCALPGSEKQQKKPKRRKPAEGRIYKCNKCSKAYLSYPALYTHTKIKHIYTKENTSITNGRMRGRPKKPIVT